jgi:hypothetical protein
MRKLSASTCDCDLLASEVVCLRARIDLTLRKFETTERWDGL